MKGDGRDVVEVVVPRDAHGARLDRFAAAVARVSRSELQRWIRDGRVTVDGAPARPSAKVREGERVSICPEGPAATAARPDPDVRFAVLHVDDDLIVVDKPAGLVVHPALGHADGTLVNGLLALGLFAGSSFAHDPVRPGIVHRLDKGTSGVMVVARTPGAREALKAQFQEHSIDRAYVAIVAGEARSATHATLHGRDPRDRIRFTTHVTQGKTAVTHVRVLGPLCGATHVECTLGTGRTHQIRVHLAESGTPVVGDSLYGRPSRDPRVRAVAERLGHQALHARVLGFVHPRSGQRVRYEAPPPADYLAALAALAELAPPSS
ncbi:MAG TPA: RluA family pseudouridine synthase [Polyangiaceae bacterium]|nr:RluA family pseudouridine synthase [Polyangiaceae bacterium]